MRQDIEDIIVQHSIGAEGFTDSDDPLAEWPDHVGPPVEDQVDRCIEFLNQLPRTKTVSRRGSSYGYKHVVEGYYRRKFCAAEGRTDDCFYSKRDPYVSNAALIVAAFILGFEVQRIRSGLSAFLNVGATSRWNVE